MSVPRRPPRVSPPPIPAEQARKLLRPHLRANRPDGKHVARSTDAPERKLIHPPNPNAKEPERRTDMEARITERRKQVFDLAKTGFSVRDIAAAVKVSPTTVWEDLQVEQQALRDITVGLARHVRDMELERLARITASLYPLTLMRREEDPSEPTGYRTTPPDLKAISTLLSVMERRARLLGLDAPDEHIHMDIPYHLCTEDQLARIAAGADLRTILAEIEQSGRTTPATAASVSVEPAPN